jgi:hypothetical protein
MTCFLSASGQENTCNFALEQTPLSNDTIDSVPRHREVGRAQDLSAPLHYEVEMVCSVQLKIFLINLIQNSGTFYYPLLQFEIHRH